MHLPVDRERPDVRAVVHPHPPHAIALTLAGIGLEEPMIPELATLGRVPTAPCATPGTEGSRRPCASTCAGATPC